MCIRDRQYYAQDNMTDVLAALTGLVHCENDSARALSRELLDDFHARWHDEALVMNLWFQVQAMRPSVQTLEDVIALRASEEFDVRNPNKVRALLGAYFHSNPLGFHRVDHAGYGFFARQVAEIDALNPQIAARLITPLTRWRRYAPSHAGGMRAALEELLGLAGLSPDSYEVISKSLAPAPIAATG